MLGACGALGVSAQAPAMNSADIARRVVGLMLCIDALR
jgi:hypothetical protein